MLSYNKFNKRIAVVIAVKNEKDSILNLVMAMYSAGYQVVMVDGGSTDYTEDHVPNLDRIHILHGRVSGIGPCLVQGMWYAVRELGVDRCLTMDAGGSHDPHDAQRLLLYAKYFDVVVGSRFARRGHYKGRIWRSVFSRVASLACSLKTGFLCTDWTSGFRVYSKRAVEHLVTSDFKTKMHAWQIEALRACTQADPLVGGPMSYTGVGITYTAGRSSFNWRIAIDALRVWKDLPPYGYWYR